MTDELNNLIDGEINAIIEAAGPRAGGRTVVCQAIENDSRAKDALASAVLRIIQLRAEAEGLLSFQWDKADRLREQASAKHYEAVEYLVNLTKLHATIPSASMRDRLRRVVGGKG